MFGNAYNLGLPLQLTTSILVTTLLFASTHAMRRKFLDCWTLYWTCQSLGLSLLLTSQQLDLQVETWPGYLLSASFCLTGYVQLYFLAAGCWHWSTGRLVRRHHLWLFFPAVLLALLLPWIARWLPDFQQKFRIEISLWFYSLQALVLAVGYFLAWLALRGSRKYRQVGQTGSRILALALLVQTLQAFHFLPVLVVAGLTHSAELFHYFQLAVVYDLVTKVFLAFGMVIVGMESVRQELSLINENLTAATQRLQQIASKDQLTEALNRHAFYSILEHNRKNRHEPVRGSVVVLDIDDLKPINDRYGHGAGDVAIRTVSKAIRSVIRADDLLFRWGGDEFLVILPNVSESEVRIRFDRLRSSLLNVQLQGVPDPVNINVSTGIVPFSNLNQLEKAITDADEAMYAQKQQSKIRHIAPAQNPPEKQS